MKRIAMLLGVVLVLSPLVSACASPTPEIIEKEVIVERVVTATKEVPTKTPKPPTPEKMVEALEATGFGRFTGDAVKLQGPMVMGETGWEAELTQTQSRALQATGVTEEQFNRGIAAIQRDDEYARRVIEAYKSH